MKYYFGGKFNPFTKGHLSIVSDLLHMLVEGRWRDRVPEGDGIVIGVKSGEMPGAEGIALMSSAEYRIEMVEAALGEFIAANTQFHALRGLINVVEQTVPRTWAYFQSKPKWFPEDGKVTIVVGADEKRDFDESWAAEDVGGSPDAGKWHHAKDINANYEMFSSSRDPFVSSTRVREIFRANPFVNYSDVADYIQKSVYDCIIANYMYWQEGDEAEARQAENKFLAGYDMSKFPRPSCTATIALFCDGDVLLVRRKGHPFKGFWALPGGFFDVEKDESLEETAERELEEEAGISLSVSPEHQHRTYSAKGLDPRGRIVDTVFCRGLAQKPEFAKAGDDAAELAWWPVSRLPRMAFHHRKAIEDAYFDLNA